MEFHGIPSFTHGLSAEFHDLSTCANHGIPKFKWVKHGIAWNSKSYVVKAWNSIIYVRTYVNHAIPRFKCVKHGIPCNSELNVNKAWNSMIYVST